MQGITRKGKGWAKPPAGGWATLDKKVTALCEGRPWLEKVDDLATARVAAATGLSEAVMHLEESVHAALGDETVDHDEDVYSDDNASAADEPGTPLVRTPSLLDAVLGGLLATSHHSVIHNICRPHCVRPGGVSSPF